MITKTIKMEESLIREILEISKIYNISFSDFIRKALKKEIEENKNNFFYKMKEEKFIIYYRRATFLGGFFYWQKG